jgi:hypothetical protein
MTMLPTLFMAESCVKCEKSEKWERCEKCR